MVFQESKLLIYGRYGIQSLTVDNHYFGPWDVQSFNVWVLSHDGTLEGKAIALQDAQQKASHVKTFRDLVDANDDLTERKKHALKQSARWLVFSVIEVQDDH